MQFSLDSVRRSHKRNRYSALDSVDWFSLTWSYRSVLGITIPAPLLAKTSLQLITSNWLLEWKFWLISKQRKNDSETNSRFKFRFRFFYPKIHTSVNSTACLSIHFTIGKCNKLLLVWNSEHGRPAEIEAENGNKCTLRDTLTAKIVALRQ